MDNQSMQEQLMENIKLSLILAAGLLAACLAPPAINAEGHLQSGIIGTAPIAVVTATPDGEGFQPVPPRVRVYSDRGTLITELETDENGLFTVALKPGKCVVWAYYPPAPGEGCVNFCLVTDAVSVRVKKKHYTSMGTLVWRPV